MPPQYSTDGTEWDEILPEAVHYFFGDIFFTRKCYPAAEDKAAHPAWQAMDRGAISVNGSPVRHVSNRFVLFLKISLFGMMMQLHDPYFPHPKNRWVTAGYAATTALELGAEQPGSAELVERILRSGNQSEDCDGEIDDLSAQEDDEPFGTTATASDKMAKGPNVKNLKGKKPIMAFLDAPKDEMDEKPLTHFLGPCLSEALRLAKYPELFCTEDDQEEFESFFPCIWRELFVLFQPVNGKHTLNYFLAKYSKRNAQRLAIKEAYDKSRTDEQRAASVQRAILNSERLKELMRTWKAYTKEEKEKLGETWLREYNIAYDIHRADAHLLTNPLKTSPSFFEQHIARERLKNLSVRDDDALRMGPMKSAVYQRGLDTAKNERPWDYVRKPYIHSRDRSFDTETHIAVASFVIPPAIRTIMEDFEQEWKELCEEDGEAYEIHRVEEIFQTTHEPIGGIVEGLTRSIYLLDPQKFDLTHAWPLGYTPDLHGIVPEPLDVKSTMIRRLRYGWEEPPVLMPNNWVETFYLPKGHWGVEVAMRMFVEDVENLSVDDLQDDLLNPRYWAGVRDMK